MVGSKLKNKHNRLQQVLLDMDSNDKGKKVLQSLGFKHWLIVDDEEMEFMIDLMDTLESTE